MGVNGAVAALSSSLPAPWQSLTRFFCLNANEYTSEGDIFFSVPGRVCEAATISKGWMGMTCLCIGVPTITASYVTAYICYLSANIWGLVWKGILHRDADLHRFRLEIKGLGLNLSNRWTYTHSFSSRCITIETWKHLSCVHSGRGIVPVRLLYRSVHSVQPSNLQHIHHVQLLIYFAFVCLFFFVFLPLSNRVVMVSSPLPSDQLVIHIKMESVA